MKVCWLMFVLLMPLTAAFGAEQPPVDPNQRIIEMDGHGEARANPDQATLSFAIETKDSSAHEAAVLNAQIAAKVIAALKSKVGASGKVETGGYSLSPLYTATTPGQSDHRIGDWVADNDVVVECDPSIAGSVLDAAQAEGAVGSSSIDQQSGKATMELHIRASALKASEAIRLSAEKARKATDAIKGKLTGKGTSKIVQGNVQPEGSAVGGQTQDIIGYQASNSISVETSAIDQVGSLIDLAIAAGATRANFVTFNLRDDSKARSEAIADACKDAQLKANSAAQVLGLKIKRVTRITSVGDFRPMQGGYVASFQSSVVGATTPIRPGEMSVPAIVTVTYELE